MSDFDERWQQSEREYTSNSEELLSILRVIPQISQNQRDDYQQRGQTCLKNMERAVTDLTQILRQNRSTSAQKDQYRQQLNVYKQQLKSQKSNFSEALQKQRYKAYSMHEREERQNLLRGNEIIDSTQDALDQSKQIVAETEILAIDTSDQVNAQGVQLENVLANVNDINEISARARRIMLGMARRLMTDRIIQIIIIFLELGIIGGLLYWKFR
eukprot:424084_1